MTKKLLALFFAFLLIGCSGENKQENNTTSEDLQNKTQITRVFAFHPRHTAVLELVYPQGMIGLNYKPYPEDTEFMPENVATLPVLGMMDRVNYEQIVILKPDLIIFPDFTDESVISTYEKLGVKILRVSTEFKDIEAILKVYGEALNVKEKTDKLLSFYHNITQKMDDLHSKITQKPRIYFAQGLEGLSSECVKEGETDDLATMIGGENVIKCEQTITAKNALPMDFERLIALQPEAIFVREIGLYKELMESPNEQWQRIKAVQDKKIYYAPSSPSNWLHRPPSVMRILGYSWAFSKLHPELLSDEEMKQIAKEFFAEFLRPLSDEDYARLEGK